MERFLLYIPSPLTIGSLHLLSYSLESPPGFELPYFCTHPPLPYYLHVFLYHWLEHGPTQDAQKSGHNKLVVIGLYERLKQQLLSPIWA